MKYGIIENDRSPGKFLGGLSLAIGPHFFSPSEFWSFEAYERFDRSATTEAVAHNLRLLDEFLAIQEGNGINTKNLNQTTPSKSWLSKIFHSKS